MYNFLFLDILDNKEDNSMNNSLVNILNSMQIS